MDSKRKVNGAPAGEDLDDRAAKRRKLPSDNGDLSQGETAETTTHYGLKLLEVVKKTEDKSGRLIATGFLKLPSKRDLPDYYQFTKMPIALDTIEAKLNRREFPTLTSLESYFKRMISNAKEYNEKGSTIYDDSERIRKALSNFMTKTNPAYKTPGYIAFPTPLPEVADDVPSDVVEEPEPEPEPEAEPEPESDAEAIPTARKRGRPPKNPQAHAQKLSATPVRRQYHYTDVGYEGLNFQQAQEKIVEDLMREKESPDDDYPNFEVFIDLPPRVLKDYYRMIPNPISLGVLQKRVKGMSHKKEAVGISEFKTWASFEEEASYLWKNAWHYNEDGSEIFNLATTLQSSFHKYLKEAKLAVPEPVGPKIKLKMPDTVPKITLKFGTNRTSPTDSPTPQPNEPASTINLANGSARRNPFSGSHSAATPVPNLEQLAGVRSTSGSVSSPTPSNPAPVKNEEGARNSPIVSGYPLGGGNGRVLTPATGSGMPPPSTPGLPNQNIYTPSGYAQSFPHQPQYQQPNPGFESRWRQAGQDASDAMITNLSVATHPGLNISRHFRMDLPPSPNMTQQSVTINLPSTHYYLQIKPTIAASLLERQYKLFVTCGNRLHAMPTIPGHAVDQRHPLFEARLLPGVNRIEIELIAALPKGGKPVNGQDFELEKITVFANLMRS